MVAIYPAGVKVQGNIKLQAVLAITSLTAPSLATDINAATSLDISCFTTAAGWNPAGEQNTGEAPRRLCSTVTRNQLGNAQYTLPVLEYAVNPQGAALSDGVKAYEMLTPDLTIFLVERLGMNAITVDWAVGQYVNIWPVTLGLQQPIKGDATNEFSEFTVSQQLVVAGSGEPITRVKLAA